MELEFKVLLHFAMSWHDGMDSCTYQEGSVQELFGRPASSAYVFEKLVGYSMILLTMVWIASNKDGLQMAGLREGDFAELVCALLSLNRGRSYRFGESSSS